VCGKVWEEPSSGEGRVRGTCGQSNVRVIVIVITNQDSTSSRLLPGSSYSCCIRNLHALPLHDNEGWPHQAVDHVPRAGSANWSLGHITSSSMVQRSTWPRM
jgi:hypothetical protein